MGRYQHYAIAIFTFSLGYLLQIPLAWRQLSFWAKLSYGMTGVFFASVATVFWFNPWLDWKVAVQTEDKEQFRRTLMVSYLLFSLLVGVIWIKWFNEENKLKRRKTQ